MRGRRALLWATQEGSAGSAVEADDCCSLEASSFGGCNGMLPFSSTSEKEADGGQRGFGRARHESPVIPALSIVPRLEMEFGRHSRQIYRVLAVGRGSMSRIQGQ